MEAIATKRKVQKIVSNSEVDILYYRLKEDYPVILEMELRKINAMLALNRIKNGAKPNEITMEEIVDEVNAVRKERYERSKRSV